MRDEFANWNLSFVAASMNLGIAELVFVCGIVGLLLLFTAMVSGVGLRFLRKQNNVVEKQDPFESLRMRYARGEITREQYEQMKQDLA
jgi:uncharacterized membrane protein